MTIKNKMLSSLALAAGLVAGVFAPAANAQISINGNSFDFEIRGYTTTSLTHTYGIFTLNSVTDSDGSSAYQSNGTQYYGVFSGTNNPSVLSPEFQVNNLTVEIYAVPSGSVFQTIAAAGDGAFNTTTLDYAGITDVGDLLFTGLINPLNGFYLTPPFATSFGTLFSSAAQNNLFLNSGDLDLYATTIFGLQPSSSQIGNAWQAQLSSNSTAQFSAVPEPSTYGIMAVGALVGLVGMRRRMTKKAA